jgi:hypothetical protein
MLCWPLSGERLQPIAGRNPQVSQTDCGFHLVQLPEYHFSNIPPASIVPMNEKLEGVGILEVLDLVAPEYNAQRSM